MTMTWEDYLKPCQHLVWEDVLSNGGDVIARQCKGCLKTTEVAVCDGCQRRRVLNYIVKAKRRRYCSEDCYRQQLAKRKKEQEKNRKARER